MTARTPYTFTSTPVSRTGPSSLADKGLRVGDTVHVASESVASDGTLRPDSDREVYVYAAPTGGYGFYVLASTLTKAPAFKVGDRVKIAEPAFTALGGYVYAGARGKVGTVQGHSGRDVQVVGDGFDQYVGPQYLTIDDSLRVGDRVEYIGTETARHIGKVGTVTRADGDTSRPSATVSWKADGDTAATLSRGSRVSNLRKSSAPAPSSAADLAVGQYVVTAAPTFGASPLPVREFIIGEVVTLEEGYTRPDVDGDVRVRSARTRGLVWVRANVLSPVVLPTTPAPAEPTLAERFPVGRKVVVSANPTTSRGAYVAPTFAGAVATITSSAATVDDVRVKHDEHGYTNIVGPEHLTLLPEGVELVKPTVREPLAFAAAYAKAVEFRGEPTTSKQVAKTSKLAELLVEVSK